MQSKRAVAIGFATLDYVVELGEQFFGTGTKAIKHLSNKAWPRAGGAALYASRQLAMAGFDAAPITWVGSDTGAGQYQAACRESGVNTDGVVSQAGAATPTCILMYQPDGDYGCLFDAGTSRADKLTEQQRRLIQASDLVLIAVGPPLLANELVSLIRPNALVAWIAKTDHTACPDDVRTLYSARADYIFCNGGERGFVDASFAAPRSESQVIVETRGSDGVLVESKERRFLVPVEYIETPDTTGAGDTFAGATMAQILGGQADLRLAVESGIEQTASLLRKRC